MAPSLTFIDCSSCGKRIRSNAAKCHHCHHENSPDSVTRSSALKKSTRHSDEHDADSHMALEGGGYDADEDESDYDEFLQQEFPNQSSRKPRVKRWVWITAWVVIFATLMPYLYYVLILAG